AADAARHARAALRDSPLAAGAWRVLGEVALQHGDAAQAEARFRIAARLDPRDVATQSWLAAAALRAGRLQDALWHLDAVLRVRPDLAAALDPQLLALALAPGAQPAWSAVFAAQPPWGPGFFTWACRQPTSANPAVDVLYASLRATPAGLDAGEWGAYLDRLLGQRRWMDAYLAWVQSLPPAQRAHLDNVFNGDFSDPVSNRGFDWHLDYVPGAEVRVVPRAGSAGSALEVHFLDQRVAFAGQVRERLALAPGHYRLSGLARLDDLRNERGLQWTVSCAGDGRLIGATARMRGSQPWRLFSADVRVPATGCGAQWLRLGLAWRIPAEQWAGGRAWFTDLRVVRSAPAPGRG
ncbi:MAG: tetratricopeptide repeat protein, partial [Xanthomonadaceae bacterium]|nr:tetratricopeptide repeat protein [Xanthomonadaceae bacterium]